MQIDPRIERIARIEIEKTVGDLEPAERQRRFDVFQPNESLQPRMQSGAGQLQVDDRAAVGEISANQKWIFRLDRDIEFPIANRRIGKRKFRTRSPAASARAVPASPIGMRSMFLRN